jgi:hypothetical protein
VHLRVFCGKEKKFTVTVLLIINNRVVAMKDPFEVLQKKEKDLLRVKKEIEALRVAAGLLEDEPVKTADHPIKKVADVS